MARKKEIDKQRILDAAYKLAVRGGIESLTARNIAKAVNCSTQPIYLEFENMQDLRNQVLARISDELKSNTLQQNFTGEPLIDLDLSYLYFVKEHVDLFRAMFVDGKFGNQMIVDTLMGLGIEKFKQQFDAEQYSDERLKHIVIANWIAATGLATLLINKMANFTQAQMVSVLKAQIHDAMLNDRLTNVEENPLFAADTDASLEERLG
ncbi:TetR/AcrR family transcriptional regulator [Lactobacillus paragasseri]|uniref:TetR/AcrR family transcriptional regulator n=1 Tax=Lactobacillus paragasseri TaxID=2107999 RepID=UPI0012E268FF|nr:TetR/AcrR family transcriptional regulator [Lactobacillus paragasseri]MDK8086763.1 TetR/AcrR family transcriptional regulator [Lactobacillus paragasseri]MDX5118703.1 TetR/AcrR family transcriptional regulator [Lactobacillus paragasseri]MDX5122576.1 TetR/AcrR family transcriptional regulator [Lactobacillus paragasseri]QGT98405.1 TetR/AcrR family transcriptional regulator [Lactobacillus paragasseri]UWI47824.1 TetR/AcrR family transcriptional regulator [Lactobacillus paragasseri]